MAHIDEAAVYQRLAERDLDLRRRAGQTTPGAGVTKPLDVTSINSLDTLIASAQRWHDDNLRAKGGAAYDTMTDHPDDTYAGRRYDHMAKIEGVRRFAYDDATGRRVTDPAAKKGYITVGIGFNMDRPDARKVFKTATGMGDDGFNAVYSGKQALDDSQVRRLFDHTIQESENIVSKKFGNGLPEHRRMALVSMAFNGPALLGPNITKMITGGDYHGATNAILYHSNARKNKGLAARRYQEAALFVGPADAGRLLPSYKDYMKDYV